MTTSTIIVSFSVHGQQGISDVEIPDDRGLFEITAQLVDALHLADMRVNRVKELEIVEPAAANPKLMTSSQSALSADVRDGAWIIAHLERQTSVSPNVTFSMPNLQVTPTTQSGSQSISFQRRVVSDGTTLTREESNS